MLYLAKERAHLAILPLSLSRNVGDSWPLIGQLSLGRC